VGEPWQTFFTPVELESVLRSARFSAVRSVSVEDAARYFAGRHDALAAPRRVSIAVATV
jgi:O-methyltransferase involved in polyketide biosynthesis